MLFEWFSIISYFISVHLVLLHFHFYHSLSTLESCALWPTWLANALCMHALHFDAFILVLWPLIWAWLRSVHFGLSPSSIVYAMWFIALCMPRPFALCMLIVIHIDCMCCLALSMYACALSMPLALLGCSCCIACFHACPLHLVHMLVSLHCMFACLSRIVYAMPCYLLHCVWNRS